MSDKIIKEIYRIGEKSDVYKNAGIRVDKDHDLIEVKILDISGCIMRLCGDFNQIDKIRIRVKKQTKAILDLVDIDGIRYQFPVHLQDISTDNRYLEVIISNNGNEGEAWKNASVKALNWLNKKTKNLRDQGAIKLSHFMYLDILDLPLEIQQKLSDKDYMNKIANITIKILGESFMLEEYVKTLENKRKLLVSLKYLLHSRGTDFSLLIGKYIGKNGWGNDDKYIEKMIHDLMTPEEEITFFSTCERYEEINAYLLKQLKPITEKKVSYIDLPPTNSDRRFIEMQFDGFNRNRTFLSLDFFKKIMRFYLNEYIDQDSDLYKYFSGEEKNKEMKMLLNWVDNIIREVDLKDKPIESSFKQILFELGLKVGFNPRELGYNTLCEIYDRNIDMEGVKKSLSLRFYNEVCKMIDSDIKDKFQEYLQELEDADIAWKREKAETKRVIGLSIDDLIIEFGWSSLIEKHASTQKLRICKESARDFLPLDEYKKVSGWSGMVVVPYAVLSQDPVGKELLKKGYFYEISPAAEYEKTQGSEGKEMSSPFALTINSISNTTARSRIYEEFIKKSNIWCLLQKPLASFESDFGNRDTKYINFIKENMKIGEAPDNGEYIH